MTTRQTICGITSWVLLASCGPEVDVEYSQGCLPGMVYDSAFGCICADDNVMYSDGSGCGPYRFACHPLDIGSCPPLEKCESVFDSWGSTTFECVPIDPASGREGEPCGSGYQCGPGLVCGSDFRIPGCDADFCCGAWCTTPTFEGIDGFNAEDVGCSIPGTMCRPSTFLIEEAGFFGVGVCEEY